MHPLLLSALAVLVFTPAALRAETWTLDRAVATALERHPDARVAQARVDAAQSLVDQAQSAWRPQISLSGRYTDTNSPMLAFGSILNQRAFNFGLDFNRPGRIDNLNASGTVAYNLYAGGRPTAGRSAAKAGTEAAALDLRAAQQRLVAEVVRAALNLRKAREAVGAIEAGVRSYEAAVAVARARYDAGQLLKADLLSLEVQLAQTRETLASSRHGAALASRAFHFVLGLEATADSVELLDDDPALARLTVPATGDFTQRPELLGLQARVRAAEAMVEAARGARRPNVNAFWNRNRTRILVKRGKNFRYCLNLRRLLIFALLVEGIHLMLPFENLWRIGAAALPPGLGQQLMGTLNPLQALELGRRQSTRWSKAPPER
jgi:outer membrane protein TolC